MDVLTAPSILSADFTDIAGALDLIESSGGDWVHLDVMDGRFVPNLTFGPKMVADIRARTSMFLDTHLMMVEPERYVAAFVDAGADQVTFHIEASIHAHRTVQLIREAGGKAGISVVPSTPASHLDELLEYLDVILIMTVNPGFGGQELIPKCLDKVKYLDQRRREHGFGYRIAVDGGINRTTAGSVLGAGADVLITGSAFFASDDPAAEVRALKRP
jgi:ribulose-phosphate 3-epimerase